MHPITTPKKTDNKEAVTNLQAALVFLLSKQSITVTADEMNALQKQWQQEQQQANYGEATTKLVAIFQQQYGINDNADKETAAKLNEVLKGLGAFDDVVKSFLVKGTISWSDGKPYSGATVKAFDHDIRSEKFLAEATTDEDGFYEIVYTRDQFFNSDKKNTNLQVKLMGENGDILVSSKIFYNAANKLEIDLNVEVPKAEEKSEWEIIDSQLSSLLRDQKDNIHPEDLVDKDINFLSESTGIAPGRIGMWSKAYKNAKETEGIAAVVFYGWQRMDMPTDVIQLWKKPVNDLLEALKNAVAKNIIPAIEDDAIKATQSIIETIQTDAVLKPAEEGQPTNLGSILFAASTDGKDWISKEKQQQLIGIHVELDPDAKDFATKIAQIDFTPAEQTKLQQTLRLDKLTQNNPALINGLQTFVAKDQDASLKSLASLQPDEWIDLAYEHGTPAGTFIEPEVYAKQMEMAVEERLPTATLLNKINSGSLFRDQPGIADIAKKLEAAPVFDIATADVKSIGLDQGKTALVQKMQNLKKLGATWDETEVYINAGLTDVAKLADYSSDQIQNLVADGIAKERVKELHEKVKTAQAVGIGAMSYYMPMMTAGNPIITGGILSLDLPAGTKEKINNDPTLRNLFGALEQCECDPCISVLSPDAYYADLLKFIDTNNPGNQIINESIVELRPASVELRKRRPDLYDLELSCDNSEIVLPHIDLSLEILENAVVFPKEINLKTGETFWEGDPKKREISEAVKQVLKSTSEDLLITGDLTVESYKAGGYEWVIKDHYRRWAINMTEEYFGPIKNNVFQDVHHSWWNIDQTKIKELLDWLNDDNRQAIPVSIKDYFESGLLKYHKTQSEPRSIAACNVENIESDRSWKINFETQTIVEFNQSQIDKNKTEITMASADRSIEIKKEYDTKAANATEVALKNGKRGGILLSTRVEKKENITIAASGFGYLITNNYTIKLYYSVAKITIEGLTYQSTAKDRDLLARAQNKNPLAYEVLANENSVYPWSLPFDEYLTELRLLLGKGGMPRLDLINTHLPDDKKYTHVIWANEVLGLSPGQNNIITTPRSGSELWTRWGLKQEGPNYTIYDTFSDKQVTLNRAVDLLRKASVVMQQANISFSDLQHLLSTQYINPGSIVKLQIDSHCDPSNTILQNADIAPNFFDRFHRFVRLWKVASISILELDSFIAAIIIDNRRTLDDAAAIIHIAQLKTLQSKFGVSFQTLVDFFSGFRDEPSILFENGKRKESPSLYNKIFLNARLQNPPNIDFEYTEFTKNNSYLHDKPLSALLSYIASCVGLRLSDLNLLIEPVDSSEVVADLKNKSASLYYLLCIWRNVSLANILQLSLSEYTAACRLISHVDSIFTSPETLLNFCDEVAFVKKIGIGFEVLESVLTTKNDGTVLPEKELYDIINGLKAELSKVKDYYCLESSLIKTALSTSPNTGIKIPVFSIPKNDTDRWESWGLRKAQIAGKWDGINWEVELSAGSTIAGEPLKLVRRQDVLAKQSNNISVAQLTALLNTNFLNESDSDLFSAVLNTDGVLEIANLTAQHLDKIKLFLIVQRALNCEIENESLDILLSSFFGAGKEPIDADLNELLQKNNSVTSQRKQTAISYLSKTFKLPEETVNDLLSNHFNTTLNGSKAFAIELFIAPEFKKEGAKDETPSTNSVTDILLKLQKTATLNNYWKATSVQLKWLKQSFLSAGFSGFIPDSLQTGTMNYIHWKQSTLLFELAQSSAETEATLNEYLKKQFVSGKRIMDDIIITVFTDAFLLTVDDVRGALYSQNMNTHIAIHPVIPAAQFDPIFISRLFNYLCTLQKSGLSQPDFESLINQPSSIEAVRIARKLLYVRYGKDFAAALQEVNNKLRIEQRDSLVDYLCWREDLRDGNALYEKYLIDVEMQPCMKTTRLLQATAAAQLFVHRSLMNLEENIAPKSFDKKRWEWTQNYRVWEANRRVFLYPENWLFPELRDDKTEIFKTYETYLTQNEASYQNAQEGLINYAEDLVELSKITVMGMHEYEVGDPNGNPNTQQLRLFQAGRTINPPYSFYWRESINYGSDGMRWTGWEKIDQDLSPDHIVPFTYEGDLCIAWPNINKKNENSKQSYEIGLSWIRRTNKGWIESKSSIDKIKIDGLINRDERSMFLFRLKETTQIANQLKIQLFAASVNQIPVPDVINKYLLPIIDGTSVTAYNTTTITFYFSFYRRYKNTHRYVSEKYGFIYFEKLTQHTKGQRTTGGENVVEYYTPGSKGDWSPAYSDSIISFEVRNIGTNGHWFKMIFQSDKGDPPKISIDSLVDLQIFNNRAYEIYWNVVIDAEEDDPIPQAKSEDEPVDLSLKGEFNLFSDKDGEWSDDNSTPPIQPATALTQPLKPTPNTYFFSSGLRESLYPNNNIGAAPIALPDNNISNPRTYQISKQSFSLARYFAVRSSNSRNFGRHAWQIEEGEVKMLVTVSDNYRQATLKVIPTAYPEVKKMKPGGSVDLSKMFSLQSESSFSDNSFGISNLVTYNTGNLNPFVIPENILMPLPFNPSMPYALYNWEVFYHLPMYVANFLSKQHKFEEARKWFHFIFDPTTNDSETGSHRFWNFLLFRKNNEIERADKLLDILANPNSSEDKTHVQNQIAAWLADPFNPFAVARMRIGAFEWFTVTSYIKNLIAWGDQLFRRDTRESINEATMLYVMASNILGRRKEKMGAKQNDAKPKSYRSLNSGNGLDDFANKWVLFSRTGLAQNNQPDITHISGKDDTSQLASIGSTYFCVPRNDTITQLWDDVEDRLFKIRNCQNIDGVVRNLPLLDPPIDPELLIRARAAGLSISDALNDMYAPLPLYRFNVMQQKAIELCNEVKSLGSAMLSAIEKKDAEHLSLLRSGQEIEMLKLVEWIKQEQIKEAAANIDAISKSRENIIARIVYLQRQLGVNKVSFDSTGIPVLDQSFIAQVQATGAPDDFRSLSLIGPEVEQVNWMQAHHTYSMLGSSFKSGGAALTNIAALIPAGLNERLKVLGEAASVTGDFFSLLAMNQAEWEKRSGLIAGWQRRRDEWLYQAKTAVLEIKQLDKQIIASEIRKAIAEKELENHHKQIEHSSNLDEFVRKQKFSNETLYTWMESQLSNVYNTAYQMAYDQAKKAEKAFRFELGLGDEDTKFVQGDYWDSLKKGLLAGERLTQDLRRMEIAYLEKNKREFEITKHISTAMIQPGALLTLRETGSCDIELPEELFDLDFPGHYFRRIKSVSISIPCIAGPYTSINATLRLIKNEYRFKVTDPSAYAKAASDTRFREIRNPVSAIATSSSQNDSGVFELNFRDERYLPFEGAGAISTWRLELAPDKKLRQFDYNTISDIILHLKYTAREDSELKEAAITHLNTLMSNAADGKIFGRLLSLKNDFPDIFHTMKTTSTAPPLIIGKIIFPYFTNEFRIRFVSANYYSRNGNPLPSETINSATLNTNSTVSNIEITDPWILEIEHTASNVELLDDIFILINYKLEAK